MKILNQEHLAQFIGLVSTSLSAITPTDPDFIDAVATTILHANPDMGDIPADYVANRVAKMLANKAAYELIQKRKQAETKTEVLASGTIQEQKI